MSLAALVGSEALGENRGRSWLANPLTRRLLPFLAVTLLVLVEADFFSGGTTRPVAFAAAGVAAALLLAAMYMLPWSRISERQGAVVPLGWLGVVYLLELSLGSAGSSVAPLVLLPVVWFALYGTKWDFVVVLLGTPAAVVLPHFADAGSGFDGAPFREAAILTLIATLVGVVVHRLVRQLQDHAQLERTSSTVARRLLTDDVDTRQEVCAAASSVSGAAIAWLLEPDGDGGLAVTAKVGPGPQSVRLQLSDKQSGAVRAFVTGERRFVPNAVTDASLAWEVVQRTGTRSALFQPVLREGQPIAVLVVAWRTRRRRLSDPAIGAITLLAAEAAIAIERTDRLQELRRAREEAERARDAMDELMAHASHDLRTPLNAIMGFAAVADQGDLDPRSREAVTRIGDAGAYMLKLVQGMLRLRWIQGSQEGPELKPVSVEDTVAASFVLLEARAAERATELRGPSSRASVRANPEQLQEVLLNLIENAIEYGKRGGSVRVSIEPASRPGFVRLDVTDDGQGIPASELPRVFEPFFRHRGHGDGEGVGLGLAACHAAIERMAGTIGVESEVGLGTTFTIELPRAEVVSGPPKAPAGRSPARPLPLPTSKVAAAAPVGAKLLYIEDNPANRALLELLLEDIPELEFIGAASGEEGLAIAWEQSPDAILVDLSLPRMSGAEVLAALKSRPETRGIPVAVLSASADLDDDAPLLEAGAVACLSKPYDVGDLLELIASMLEPASAGPVKRLHGVLAP